MRQTNLSYGVELSFTSQTVAHQNNAPVYCALADPLRILLASLLKSVELKGVDGNAGFLETVLRAIRPDDEAVHLQSAWARFPAPFRARTDVAALLIVRV